MTIWNKYQKIETTYLDFGNYRIELAKLFDEHFGSLYEKWYENKITEEEYKEMVEFMNENFPYQLCYFFALYEKDGKIIDKLQYELYKQFRDIYFESENKEFEKMHNELMKMFKKRNYIYFK